MLDVKIGNKKLVWKKDGIQLKDDVRGVMGCLVKASHGHYLKIITEKNPMHDGAWDNLINGQDLKQEEGETKEKYAVRKEAVSRQRKRIFSFIPSLFWGYKEKGTARSGAAWKRCLLRDTVFGRQKSKINGTVYDKVKGQIEAFAGITQKNTIMDGFKAYFTLAGESEEARDKQFEGMEKIVASNKDEMLKALKSLPTIKDPIKLMAKVLEIRSMADGIHGANEEHDGLADAAALVAASAMREVAKLRDTSKTKCGTDGKAIYTDPIKAQKWIARAQLWLKIARRLAHPLDATIYANNEDDKDTTDPLFAGGVSTFVCPQDVNAKPKIVSYSIFTTSDAGLEVHGPVKAFLLSSYEAAFGCEKKKTGGHRRRKTRTTRKRRTRKRYRAPAAMAAPKIRINIGGTNPNS